LIQNTFYFIAIGQFGNMAIWQSGTLALWQLGTLALWQFGNLAFFISCASCIMSLSASEAKPRIEKLSKA
jgi:hypothetical protein